MRNFLQAVTFSVLLCLSASVYAADNFTISADQWALPRSAAALVRLAPLREAVKDWLDHPEGRIVIVESGSDTASLWAGELDDWLVALGVPADHIGKHVSGEQGDDSITLSVEY